MATANGSSTPGPLFPSRDHDPSNPPDILQSNDGVDRVFHQGANWAGRSSYSSTKVDGSTVLSKPPWGQPDPTWGVTRFTYQTTAWERLQRAADDNDDDDGKRAMWSQLYSVCPPHYFNLRFRSLGEIRADSSHMLMMSFTRSTPAPTPAHFRFTLSLGTVPLSPIP